MIDTRPPWGPFKAARRVLGRVLAAPDPPNVLERGRRIHSAIRSPPADELI
jgi:hypothetical protein